MSGWQARMARRAMGLGDEPVLLALESSCDETAAAVLRGRKVLSSAIASQVAQHERFGGVVPEIASRMHIESIDPLIDKALKEAGMALGDIEAIAVTNGPGLVGALLVAVSTAKAMAYTLDVPLVGVHHIHGHICANYLHDPLLAPPFLALVISGGHTHLVHITGYGVYHVLGRTRDDAAGEAFDKAARALGLPYPGGPNLEKAAKEGTAHIPFTRPKVSGSTLDFSFSGLKTQVVNRCNHARQTGEALPVADIAASFQQAVVDILVDRTLAAVRQSGLSTVALAGGVAANQAVRQGLSRALAAQGCRFCCPPMALCTDNAAMIGAAGLDALRKGEVADLSMNAEPALDVEKHAAETVDNPADIHKIPG